MSKEREGDVCVHCGQRIIFRKNTWVVVSGGTWWGFCGKNPNPDDLWHKPKGSER